MGHRGRKSTHPNSNNNQTNNQTHQQHNPRSSNPPTGPRSHQQQPRWRSSPNHQNRHGEHDRPDSSRRRSNRHSPYPSPPSSNYSHKNPDANNRRLRHVSQPHHRQIPHRLGLHAVTHPTSAAETSDSASASSSTPSNPNSDSNSESNTESTTGTGPADPYRAAHLHLLRRSLRFRAYLTRLLSLSRVAVEEWLPEAGAGDVLIPEEFYGPNMGFHFAFAPDEDGESAHDSASRSGYESTSSFENGHNSSAASAYSDYSHIQNRNPQMTSNDFSYWEGFIDGHEEGVVEGDVEAESSRREERRGRMIWRPERTVEIPVGVERVVYPWDGDHASSHDGREKSGSGDGGGGEKPKGEGSGEKVKKSADGDGSPSTSAGDNAGGKDNKNEEQADDVVEPRAKIDGKGKGKEPLKGQDPPPRRFPNMLY